MNAQSWTTPVTFTEKWLLHSKKEIPSNLHSQHSDSLSLWGFFFKGSVSRVLRWVLLYIDQKLFSRPIIAAHNIFTFLKGQFTINKKQAGAPLYYDMVLSSQYWNRRKMGVSAILKFAKASLSDMISRKSTYTPYCRSFSWFYEFILRRWRHFCIPIWQKHTVSVISSHSEEPVAKFNIANLNLNL